MMRNHTPGPWRYGRTLNNGLSVFSKVEVGSPDHIVAVAEENTANARLIAAAPELLEALDALGEACHNEWGPRFRESAVGKKALAAIAKATGE